VKQGAFDPNIHVIGSTNKAAQAIQKIRVTAGAAALISTQEDTVVVKTAALKELTQDNATILGVENQYRSIENGFYIKPTLQGDQVLLEIKDTRAQFKDRQAGTTAHQAFATTVAIPLNTWFQMTGSAQSSSETVISTDPKNTPDALELWIKVEKL
jgi:hypothetical protein